MLVRFDGAHVLGVVAPDVAAVDKTPRLAFSPARVRERDGVSWAGRFASGEQLDSGTICLEFGLRGGDVDRLMVVCVPSWNVCMHHRKLL